MARLAKEEFGSESQQAEMYDELAAKVIGDIDIINRLGGIAYGFVDPEQLRAIIARATVQASELLDDAENLTPEIETAAERMRATLPEVDMDLADKHIYRPTTEDIAYWGATGRQKVSIVNRFNSRTGSVISRARSTRHCTRWAESNAR